MGGVFFWKNIDTTDISITCGVNEACRPFLVTPTWKLVIYLDDTWHLVANM